MAENENQGTGKVTVLLRQWRDGSEEALANLMPLVYEELRRLARAHMRKERTDHTLEPTALVHQAYQRLIGLELDWRDRAHFLNMASRTMRRVLVDHARTRRREKRGGDLTRVTLGDEHLGGAMPPSTDILALNDALDRLAIFDERKSGLVQAHYFAGLSYRDLTAAFEISEATVHRELKLAKAWLSRELDTDAA